MLWAALGTFAGQFPVAVGAVGASDAMAGVLLASFSVALGVGARVAGRLMDRSGRRRWLAVGYVIMAASGVVGWVAVAGGSLPLLFTTFVLLGLGAAAAQLGRAAVADMYEPKRRGRAVGALIVGGTFGAVGGPFAASGVHAFAERAGLGDPLAVPWLVVPVLSAAALAMILAIRPDPSRLAVGGPAAASTPPRAPRVILGLRPGVAAATTIGLSQAVMSTFMGIVPLAIHRHGAGQAVISGVVSGHLAGMFAFSPLFGAVLDRWGRRRGLLLGLALLITGVALSAFLRPTVVLGVGLFLVGVGWSAAYLASTAVISDLTVPAERGGALGLTDLISGFSAAVGVPAGAALAAAAGLPALGIAVLVLLMAPLVLQLRLRERSPGVWDAAPARS